MEDTKEGRWGILFVMFDYLIAPSRCGNHIRLYLQPAKNTPSVVGPCSSSGRLSVFKQITDHLGMYTDENYPFWNTVYVHHTLAKN